MENTRKPSDEINVFISYSRRDIAFAREIMTALEKRGLKVKIDTRDLPTLEEWRRELLGLIRAADAIVFVVSKHSANSHVCHWEVEEAAKLNKRLAPIVLESVDIAELPAPIAEINYLLFDGSHDFEAQADKLATALQTNLIWIKEHTRLGDIATRWAERGESAGLLLRGQELNDAEGWIAARPPTAPEPPDVVRQLLLRSRQAATRRQRTLAAGSLAAAIIAIVTAAAMFWLRTVAVDREEKAVVAQLAEAQQRTLAQQNANEAIAQRELAEKNAQEAIKQQTLAEKNENEAVAQKNLAEKSEQEAVVQKQTAEAQRDRALLNQSRFLDKLARDELAKGNTAVALLLSLEGLPDASSNRIRPWHPPSEITLRQALIEHREAALGLHHGGPVSLVGFVANGTRFWSLSGTGLSVSDTGTAQQVYRVSAPRADTTVGFSLSDDGNTGVMASRSGRLMFFDMQSGKATRELNGPPLMTSYQQGALSGAEAENISLVERLGGTFITSFDKAVRFSPDGKLLALLSRTKEGADIVIIDAQSGEELVKTKDLSLFSYPVGLSFSPDGRYFFTSGDTHQYVIDLRARKIIAKVDLDPIPPPPGREKGGPRLPNRAEASRFIEGKSEIVLATHAGELLRWNFATGRSTKIPRAKQDVYVHSADLSKNGSAAVIGTSDYAVRVLDTASGKVVREMTGHTDEVQFVKFDSSGRLVLSIAKDGTARVWDAVASEQLFIMHGQSGDSGIMSAAFSADSQSVVTGHRNGAVRVWKISAPAAPQTTKGNFGRWSRLGFAEDVVMLVATEGDDASIVREKEVTRLKGHRGLVLTAKSDPTGRYIGTTSLDGTVRLWNARTGAPLRTFGKLNAKENPSGDVTEAGLRKREPGEEGPAIALDLNWGVARTFAFSSDGERIFIGRNSGVGEVRRVPGGEIVDGFGPDGGPITDKSFHPGKAIVATAFARDDTLVAGRANGSVLVRTKNGTNRVIVVEQGEARSLSEPVFLRSTFAEEARELVVPPGITGLAPLDSGTRLAISTEAPGPRKGGTVVVIDLIALAEGALKYVKQPGPDVRLRFETPEEANAQPSDKYDREEGGFTMSGPQAADGIKMMGDFKREIGMIRAGFSGNLALSTAHLADVTDLKVSPSGRFLVTASEDLTVRIWDANTGVQKAVLIGHKGAVRRVAISPDGRRIATASEDIVLVWDVATVQIVARYSNESGVFNDLAFSPAGDVLAAVSSAGEIFVWQQFANTQALVDFGKSRTTRCLGSPERRETASDEAAPAWCQERKLYPYRRGRIGVRFADAKEIPPGQRGVVIGEIIGAPAAAAGLQRNDAVYEIGGRAVRTTDEFIDRISEARIGEPIELKFLRDGSERTTTVTPAPEDL